MNRTQNITTTMTFAMIVIASSLAAAQPDTSGVRPGLPALDILVEAATKNHPTVERNRAAVRRSQAELSSVNKRWLDGLTLDAGAQWGAYGDRTLEKLMLGSRVGFTVRLSIWDILSQGDVTEQYEAVVEEAKKNVEISQRTIIREVVAAYNEALLAERLYGIAMRERITAQVNTQTARQQFVDGEIDMSEYARITAIETNAEEKVETYRSRWDTAIKVLEIIVGRPMEDFR